MKRSFSVSIIALFVFACVPVVAFAASPTSFQPIINLSGGACTCIGTAASGSSQVGYASAPDWGCVLQTIQNGLNDVVLLATVLITIYIAWAGITYMTSATSSEARSKARQRIWNAIIGLLIVLCAWLLIDSLMKVIYNQSASLNGVPGAQLGPWNQILSAPASADCLKVNITIPPLPGLGVGNPVVANQNAGGGGVAPAATTATPSTGNGVCPVQNSGPCAVSQMGAFGNAANTFSQICYNESANGALLKSTVDKTTSGQPVSFGLMQINISANPVGSLNCPSAFNAAYTSTNHNVYILPGQMNLYNQCEAAALDPNQNIAEAAALYHQHGLSPWLADEKKCGISMAGLAHFALGMCDTFT